MQNVEYTIAVAVYEKWDEENKNGWDSQFFGPDAEIAALKYCMKVDYYPTLRTCAVAQFIPDGLHYTVIETGYGKNEQEALEDLNKQLVQYNAIARWQVESLDFD